MRIIRLTLFFGLILLSCFSCKKSNKLDFKVYKVKRSLMLFKNISVHPEISEYNAVGIEIKNNYKTKIDIDFSKLNVLLKFKNDIYFDKDMFYIDYLRGNQLYENIYLRDDLQKIQLETGSKIIVIIKLDYIDKEDDFLFFKSLEEIKILNLSNEFSEIIIDGYIFKTKIIIDDRLQNGSGTD